MAHALLPLVSTEILRILFARLVIQLAKLVQRKCTQTADLALPPNFYRWKLRTPMDHASIHA